MKNFYKGGRGLHVLEWLSHLFKSKNNRSRILFSVGICFVLLFSNQLFAQEPRQDSGADGRLSIKPLMVGEKVPEEFWNYEHLFFVNGDTIRKTLNAYRGKLLVLDFWSTTCSTCIFHQKEIGFFEDNYPNELNVVMVNPTKSKDDFLRIDAFYKRYYLKENNSELESIISDRFLESLFVFGGYPHFVWINKYGYIQTQTFRNYLDREYVAPFIDSKP
ncbi:TlpA family protein disulfide reductase [Sphingobacterium sp. LRF_L2]|uniref:TlpA family protein disulfide reductase n=1 Tax=Sphingobacterium sp. LRF_L2 TaxID=3369421 RepID=UPI003F61818C